MSLKSTPSIEDVLRDIVSEPIKTHLTIDAGANTIRPPVDLKDTKGECVAYIDLPGIDEDEVRFEWEKDALWVSGCRDFNHDVEDAEEFVQIQRPFGDYLCRIPLTETIDASKATAKYKRGVLKIHLPKRQQPGASRRADFHLPQAQDAPPQREDAGPCAGNCPDCASRTSGSVSQGLGEK